MVELSLQNVQHLPLYFFIRDGREVCFKVVFLAVRLTGYLRLRVTHAVCATKMCWVNEIAVSESVY